MISFLTKGGMGSGCVCCGQGDFIDRNRQSNGDDLISTRHTDDDGAQVARFSQGDRSVLCGRTAGRQVPKCFLLIE